MAALSKFPHSLRELPRVVSPRGSWMPRLLYGTAWKKAATAGWVERALRLGFRGVDTACQPKHYHEPGVGAAVAACLEAGLTRQELFLQTKFTPLSGQDPERVPYSRHASLAEQVRESCRVSLANLRTGYLDALLLHSPLASFELTLAAWRVFEELVQAGFVKELGISNCYDVALLERLWHAASVKPWIVQNRFYKKTGYDRSLRSFCQKRDLQYQSFWTLSANPHLLEHKTLSKLGQRYGAPVAVVLFRSLSQLGIVPLSGSTNEEHLRDALSMFDFELTEPELASVAALLM